MQYALPKHWSTYTRLHGAISQMAVIVTHISIKNKQGKKFSKITDVNYNFHPSIHGISTSHTGKPYSMM
jgi:hypothetical protein